MSSITAVRSPLLLTIHCAWGRRFFAIASPPDPTLHPVYRLPHRALFAELADFLRIVAKGCEYLAGVLADDRRCAADPAGGVAQFRCNPGLFHFANGRIDFNDHV